MISEEVKEKLKKMCFELYACNLTDLSTWTTNVDSETRYRIIGRVKDINGNGHHSITIEDIDESMSLTMNDWTLKEIFFHQSWNTLNTPMVTVFDPNGDEVILCDIYKFEKEIYDIPNWKVEIEDYGRRIVQGVKMFIEAQNYPDKKRYMLINKRGIESYTNGKPDINLREWIKCFIEVQETRRDYTEEQLQSFYGLYAKIMRLYCEYY